MAESIAQRTAGSYVRPEDQRKLLEAVLADNTKMRATINALVTNLTDVAAKLDTDTGITDTNYNEEVTATAVSDLELTD